MMIFKIDTESISQILKGAGKKEEIMAHIETQSEWEERMSLKVLDFVKNEIYLDLRFLQTALTALHPKQEEGLQAFSTDGIFLYFSSEQVIRVFKQNAPYLNRAYLHTVLHCIFFHLWIGGKRNPALWGLACDIAVEYTIDGMGKPCTKRPLSWIRQQFYDKLKAERQGISAAVIYRILLEEPDEEKINALRREFYTDDHRYWPKEENRSAKENQAQKQWNKIARQTRMEQKKRGDETKEGEELLAAQMKVLKSRRSYTSFLQKFSVLREEMKCDPDEFDLNYYTYGLRIYRNMPLIEPLESREVKKIQEFVVVLDTSYSTSGDLIKNFLKETFQVLATRDSFFSHCKMHIIQCDEKVRKDEEINSTEELEQLLNRFEVVGGGGTDFCPAFSYVNELLENGTLKNLCGLLYFTDGKGIYPKKKPDYKTAFLFLEDYDDAAVPPWAMRLRLEPEEFLEKK